MAAAASDWAISSRQPSPVSRALMMPASTPRAPNSGPAWMPIDGCSGMAAKPSSVVSGFTSAGPHVVGDAVARHVLVRAGHAVAGDRAEHDAGLTSQQPVVAEAAPFEAAGAHGLDHRVGVAHEVEVDLDAFGRAQVEHDAALAPVDVEVHQRDALHDRPRHLADVVARRRLHLDHVGAQVGEVGGDGARAEHRAR